MTFQAMDETWLDHSSHPSILKKKISLSDWPHHIHKLQFIFGEFIGLEQHDEDREHTHDWVTKQYPEL